LKLFFSWDTLTDHHRLEGKIMVKGWVVFFTAGVLLCWSQAGLALDPDLKEVWQKDEWGQTAIFPMENAPYPHESRKDGYTRNDKVYPLDPHYNDNSVALFIPEGYRAQHKTHLLFYFHGHGSSIAEGFEKYNLRQQVAASGKNIILVFPEGPKNASDSGGGKLEEAGGLKMLADEVLKKLKDEGKIPSTDPGQVVLAGHSGAYRVISFCLEHGGIEPSITATYLLDASYARLEQFVDWIDRSKRGRFRSIFTDHLAGENVQMMAELENRGARYTLRMDTDTTDRELQRQRVMFLHTITLDHLQTVKWLERFLKTSQLEEI
jgi:hypothetical protein